MRMWTFCRQILVCTSLLVMFASPAFASPDWARITLSDGTVRKAVLSVPVTKGPFPAILYMHGTMVRERGYKGAAHAGYDLEAFTKAFAEMGFVGLAPIRETEKGCCNGDEAIAEGERIIEAAGQYLKGRHDVDPARVCLVGYSEGGLISLWALSEGGKFKASVIMSAASMNGDRANSKTKSAKDLVKSRKVTGIQVPMHFTLGRNEKGGVRKGMQRFSKQSDAELTTLPGDHKSFHAIRDDVLSLIRSHCK